MNRTTFFAYVRKAPFGGRLTTNQVAGITAILDEWTRRKMTDDRWLAYMLATVFHETGATMQPVRETFAKSDAQAVSRLEKAWKNGELKEVRTPYWRDGWFGRGLVQITHEENYKKMGRLLKVDLHDNPALALDLKISIDIMFEGMTKGVSTRGDFANKSLEDYFNNKVDDPVGARRIINGKNKANLIASYHKNFLDAINEAMKARKSGTIPDDVDMEDAKPDDIPAAKSKSFWTVFTGIFASGGFTAYDALQGGGTFLGSIGNPWALLALVALLIGAGCLFWLIWNGRITINRGKALN